MASVNIKTNLSSVVGNIQRKIKEATDKEYLLRPICFDVIDLITKRIHIDGKNSAGSNIGSYSSSYLKVRQKFNRKEGDKVVVSLTRQLENDYSVIATQNGYGVGFNNIINKKKVDWVEEKKGKIFGLTSDELSYVKGAAEDLINAKLNEPE